MNSDFIIPENEPLGSQQNIRLGGVAKMRLVPSININAPSTTKTLNSVSPSLILNTFGIQAFETHFFKKGIKSTIPDTSPISRTSALGTLLFSDLQFSPAQGLPAHIPVDCALFHVTMPKNVVRTQIPGRDGRIKEYMGIDDLEINIKGIICGTNGNYPWDAVKNLVQYLKYNQSLGITSKYLNEVWDCHEIVVNNVDFEQDQATYSYQKFEISAWGEKPIEVLIQEGKQSDQSFSGTGPFINNVA